MGTRPAFMDYPRIGPPPEPRRREDSAVGAHVLQERVVLVEHDDRVAVLERAAVGLQAALEGIEARVAVGGGAVDAGGFGIALAAQLLRIALGFGHDHLAVAIGVGAATLGVKILDLRIKQIDLPTDSQVIDQVYRRMRAQRQQVASKLRAEGEEAAQQIRANADRDRQVIVAEAERDAQKLRGEGDAEATRIYGAAAGRDPGVYAFQRSLEAYRRSFQDGNTVIVLDKNDPFLQYMRTDR